MHLLILGMNYPPELTGIAPYTGGLAEHLVTRGHRVTVATTFPHYPKWEVERPYQGRWRAVEHRHGVEVRRGAVYVPRGRSTVRRLLYDSSLAASTLLNCITVSRPDVVLCVSPPIQLGVTASFLARRWQASLALLVKDLPLDAALAVGMLRPGLAFRLGRILERRVYGWADQILVISEGFRQKLLRDGVPPGRIRLIPDWVDTELIRPRAPDLGLRARAGARQGDFLILHTGNMGEKQGLDNALLAAKGLGNRLPMRLTLVGDGMDRRRLEEMISSHGIAEVTMLPLVPPEVFPSLLASADALLLNQRADVVDSVAPSKLLSYLASGRPVVAAVHPQSDAATVLRAAGGGVIVPPDDPPALAEAFRRLASDPERRGALGASGRRFAERHYARANVLAAYEAILSQSAEPARATIT
jgi:colanic acid biosynthesis glycosyl transferase WcaI